jgi:tryptophan synthase alpha chain
MSSQPQSAIARRIAERRAEGRSALIPYVTAGYPSPEVTLPLLDALVEAGMDILELGIPFSDPLADGPTIQRASFDALEAGMTVEGVLDLLRAFRARHDTPVVLFSYLNPIYHMGAELFAQRAREAGADGVLVTDLPTGSDPEVERVLTSTGLDLIRLLAPTTNPERVPEVVRGGGGFVYYISRTGVTGASQSLREELGREVEVLRSVVELPLAVGFGVSTPEQAASVAAVADGVIIGSALIQALDAGGIEGAAHFLRGIREGMDRVAARG